MNDEGLSVELNDIPYESFGGEGPLLHFAHANAYPPGCYRQFLGELATDYEVVAMHHRPLWSDMPAEELETWQLFADDLIRFFDQRGLRQVIGVGHSLGAVATMLAAAQRPELFRLLVLIDPVFMPPDILEQYWATSMEVRYQFPLVQSAVHRSDQWADQQTLFDRYRQKSVFARFSDETLWDFVRSGTVATDDGQIRLAFPKAWEARIYATLPAIWQPLATVTQPMIGIRAAESDTLFQPAWELWQEKQPTGRFVEIPAAGHMVPLEQPLELAGIVKGFLADQAGE